MGHRIAIMDQGVLQQIGSPQDVYAQPANLFVARFIGNPPMNTIEARCVAPTAATAVASAGVRFRCHRGSALRRARGRRVVIVGVRPEHLKIGSDGVLTATVTVIESLGHERHVICRLEDGQLIIVRQASM